MSAVTTTNDGTKKSFGLVDMLVCVATVIEVFVTIGAFFLITLAACVMTLDGIGFGTDPSAVSRLAARGILAEGSLTTGKLSNDRSWMTEYRVDAPRSVAEADLRATLVASGVKESAIKQKGRDFSATTCQKATFVVRFDACADLSVTFVEDANGTVKAVRIVATK